MDFFNHGNYLSHLFFEIILIESPFGGILADVLSDSEEIILISNYVVIITGLPGEIHIITRSNSTGAG